MSNIDPFKEIYKLLKTGKSAAALKIIYDENSGQINKLYSADLNHAWYVVGDIFFKLEKYEDALKAFKKSIRNRKDDWQALWAIGNCYSEIGRPVFTERYIRKALLYVDRNKRQDLNYNLGNALFDQGKYLESIKEYNKVKRSKNGGLRKLANKNYRHAKRKVDQAQE